MNDKSNMLSQLRDIGDRYIKRTLGDVDQLDALAAQALAGEPDGWRNVESLAHKIHGSGAMFGFTEVSEAAGKIERLVAMPMFDGKTSEHDVRKLIDVLRTATKTAAEERGVSK